LLIFDSVDEPEYAGVVPGGGIEPGETAGEAMSRELLEETGLEVELVRELGVLRQPGRRDPDFRHESHFVQAVPAEPTEDEWEHFIEADEVERGLVRCRWVPILAGMSVHGRNRGAFLEALVRKRVVAFVTREREGRTELLVFDYESMTELPGGRIDAHESLEEGIVREVEEETGVADLRVIEELADAGEFVRLYGRGAHETHVFHLVTHGTTPEEWDHHVTGTGMDAGLVYACRWVRLADCPPLWGKPDPLVERLRQSIAEG
jgi:ADP-ribose pyrophosphatase YjhB (NUDIX family)